jgi:DNA-binding LytR/AlgR family response regulator
MKKLNCLVIEDEPLAAEIITEYISQVSFLHTVAVCADALGAMEILKKTLVDVIFLDIHLPRLKGDEFLQSLHHPRPAVIITTAYRHYAVDGYQWDIVDYLIKPVSFTRFLVAVNKLKLQAREPARPAHYFFNVGKKRIKILVDDILYLESQKEYVQIVTKHKSILTKLQLGEIEHMLEEFHFLRIHRSFIVAIDKVDAYTATEIEINSQRLPIGRSYRNSVVAAFGKEV